MVVALACVRWVHFAAAFVLFGGSFFVGVLTVEPLRGKLEPLLRPLWLGASALLILSWIGWLSLESGAMGNGPADMLNADTIFTIVSATTFGWVWLFRLLLLLVAFGLAKAERGSETRLITVLSGLGLISLAPVGHPVMVDGFAGDLLVLNHAIHLVCGGLWVGGLYPLVLCLNRFWGPVDRYDATRSLRRFSWVGHGAVAALVLSGVFNTVMILGHFPLPERSLYGVILLFKVLLVGGMIGLALFNRYWLVPRLRSDNVDPVRRMRLTTMAEMILAIGVLGLVGFLGQFEPG